MSLWEMNTKQNFISQRSVAILSPLCTYAARVMVVGFVCLFVCLSVTLHLTSGMSVHLKNILPTKWLLVSPIKHTYMCMMDGVVMCEVLYVPFFWSLA